MSYRLSGLLAAVSLSAAVLVAGVPAASAAEAGSVASALAQAQAQTYPGESYSQYRRYGGYRGGYRGGRHYGGRGRGYGGGAALGIAGLAAGALIGGAIANSQAAPAYQGAPVANIYGQDPNAVEYCASRYRSYDPASGTFLANDGMRYSCP